MTPQEKTTIAYMYLVRGIRMDDLATMYNLNIGQVSKIIAPFRKASEQKFA